MALSFSAATALPDDRIQIIFDKTVLKNTDFYDPSNWSATGYSISAIDGSGDDYTAILELSSEMLTGASIDVNLSGIVATDGDSHDGVPINVTGAGTAPTISSVAMPSYTTIDITFSEALDPATVIPSLFSLTAPFGAATSGISGASHALGVVTLTLASELTHGLEYTLNILAGLTDVAGNPVGASAQVFTSVGDPPRVSSATAVSPTQVLVKFNQALVNDADLVNRSNYLIEPTASGRAPTIRSVSRVSASSVLLETTTMTGATGYQVIVATDGPCDPVGNCIDPAYATATFTSKATSPTIEKIEKRGPNLVSIYFDRPMLRNADIEAASTYTIPGLTVIAASLSGDRRRVDLVVSDMTAGAQYTVSIGV